MKCMNRRTAKERYELSRRLAILVLVCIGLFVAITIYDLVTGSPISSSTSAFVCLTSGALALNVVNMRNAKEEMDKEEDSALETNC